MSAHGFLTQRQFRRRMLRITTAVFVATVASMVGYVAALLQLLAAQWTGFLQCVGGAVLVGFVALRVATRPLLDPITRCLVLEEGDRASERDMRAALHTLVRMPFVIGGAAWAWWSLVGVLIAGALALRFDDFGGYTPAVVILAGVSSGFLSSVFLALLVKRTFEDLRGALASRVGDGEERRLLLPRVPLRRKLGFVMSGLTLVVLVFSGLLARVELDRRLEENATRLQQRFLAEVAKAVATGGSSAFERARRLAARRGVAEALVLVDAGASKLLRGADGVLAASELSGLRESGLERGNSNAFDSRNAMAWLRLPDRPEILVAATPSTSLRGDAQRWYSFPILAGVSILLATALATALAHDVARATQQLGAEADRLAAGDLSPGPVVESEDELGELGRSFEQMAGALRATMRSVAQSADRVDETLAEIASVSEGLASVTADQVRGIQQATESMEQINVRVQQIAESASALHDLMGESSSALTELGSAGQQLNETASILSGKVDDVSSSIEQMVRSVSQVSANTEELAEAAEETSASMEEMASAMRQVDGNARETARLSGEMVESAESGQARVRQTMEGIKASQEATQTAERVIGTLGQRATEIGTVVDVIDDVADETALLALNAAIIASQAGEHGRAFSVVADEIKELADRVLVNTKEIGALVRAVQDETANAVGAIERGSQSVASGVDLSVEAGRSLEGITQASRESGRRIEEIVAAVMQQTNAASQVVLLMERVRTWVEQIRTAVAEQDRGHAVVLRSAVEMREVAERVRGTTDEQASGSRQIQISVEEVRQEVERINGSLQEQTQACRTAAESLERVGTRTRSNEEAARRMHQATRELLGRAASLRAAVGRVRV